MTYGISFATLTAAITTVIIWHWRDISDAFFSSTSSSVEKPEADVHVQMMEATYESVPNSWYAWVGGSMLVAAIYVIVFYPMQLPVWGLLLSLVIAFLFLPACGIIAATTGTVIGACLTGRRAHDDLAKDLPIGLNVITEFIAGYLFPGQPIGYLSLLSTRRKERAKICQHLSPETWLLSATVTWSVSSKLRCRDDRAD